MTEWAATAAQQCLGGFADDRQDRLLHLDLRRRPASANIAQRVRRSGLDGVELFGDVDGSIPPVPARFWTAKAWKSSRSRREMRISPIRTPISARPASTTMTG